MNKWLLWLGLALSLVQQLSAESFTTNVIDGVSTNITEDFLLGATGPHNFLLITNGGAMTNHGQVFIGRTAEAHNNVAIVTGVGSTWHVDYLCYLGQASASNVFAILDGAHVHVPGALDMGLHYAASNNFLHVSGVGSTLTAGGLYVESGPGNQLLIEDSAAVQFGSIIVNGFPPWSGYQAITVRGVGSRLILTNLLHVDRTPANTISILDGAYFESGWSFFGTENSVGNQIIVSGPGTEWWSVGELSIATTFSSSNRIVLEGGAKSRGSRIFLGRAGWGNSYSITSGGGLSASEVNVGEDWGAFYNQLLVTDPGSTLTNFSTLIVGQRGSENSLVLSNGAFAQSGDFVLGVQHTSSNNQAIVTGTNTLWIGNRLTVGSAGHLNTMSVDQGANVFADSFLSGGQGGSGNLTVVSGRGSRLGVTNQLDLGFNFYSGNSLVITNDARVESGSGVVGSQGYRHNAIISGASWSNVTSIIIGSQSFDNVLRLSANGRLYSSNAVVGAGDNADRNRVGVSGKGTWWRVLNDLNVGEWGDSNEVAVSNGAAISANRLNVGGYFVPNPPTNFPSDANRLVIHGTNTVVNVASKLSLGYNGRSNHLELRARAELTSGSTEVATRSGSAGNTILVSDPGTRWHNTNALVLGSNGYGSTLIISNGAIVRTGPVIVGDAGVRLRVSQGCSNQFGFNQVIVAGTGTVWQVDGTLGLGRNSASNSIVLKDGATLRGADISIGEYGGTCTAEIGSFLIMESGTLTVSRVFTAPRGRFRMLSGRADIGALQSEGGPPGRQQILGGTVRADSIYASAPAQVEIGDGTRRAVLELTGGNYFSSGRIIIASNSVVAGRGSVAGFTNSGTYGTLRSVTAITNASLEGSSGFDVWISALGPATGHSVLNVAQPFPLPMVLGGRLRVALNPSFQPHPTNEFPVVMFNLVTGSFSNAPHESRLKAVDNLASFLVLYRSNAVVLTDYRSTDLDGDGIEDQWATNHFGHSPLTSAQKSADDDGDGFSNYDEFRAGTDPRDPASALRVSVTMTQGTARLQWPCVDGKTYRVYFSGDMRTWREVSDATFAFPQSGRCEWTDEGRDGGLMRFYRVAVE